jgi:hypothetical protein
VVVDCAGYYPEYAVPNEEVAVIVTKKHLSRRTVLRGAGVALALPLLDAMVPAFAGKLSAATKRPRRFVAVYAGNGMNMPQWNPPMESKLTLSTILQPLQNVYDQTIVLTGLHSNPVDLVQDGGIHPRCQTAWLTATLAKKADYNLQAGTSADQLAAQAIGTDTQLMSLELAIESAEGLSGNCAFGYGCAYNNTIAWKTPEIPLPMEDNPRAAFERLFGASDSTDREVRLAQIQKNRSILDSVLGTVSSIQPKLSKDDRRRMDQYLDAVRDVERRIARAEEQVGQDLPVIDQPAGIPGTFEEHAKLQFDLLALALQTDLTRVGTFLLARELSNLSYPEIGVPDSHHPLSHHGNDAAKLVRLAKLNAFHISMFAHFVDKLKATEDGDGTLLDNTIAVYGAGIGNSNQHDPHNLPMVVVGGSALGLKGGRHLMHPEGKTPLANLWLTLLDRVGVPNVEKFGDSTGPLAGVAIT